jgi:DUF4097 and DUF4098 domain-containing protein YvlB
MIKRMAAIAIAFAVVATSACGKDDKNPTGNNNNPTVGTYQLDKVDGAGLPAILFNGDVDVEGTIVTLKIELTAGSMTLAANGTFNGNMTLKLTVDDAPPETETAPVSGTYAVNGNTITLTSSDPEDPQVTGTIANGQLQVDIDLLETGEEFALSYKK